MIINLPLAILLALIIALISSSWIKTVGAINQPDNSKVYSNLLPRMGGLAIFIAFTVTIFLTQKLENQLIGLLIGGLIIILFGFLDDTKGLPAKVKLVGQLAAAATVVPFGIQVEFITNPINGQLIHLGVWGIPLTIFWIISVINAVYLIDSLDGLAGGTSFIASLTLAAVTWQQATLLGGAGMEVVVLILILAAATLGFLRYNFFPAKIFLGSTGSMFLGYVLGTLAIMEVAKSATAISVFVPMVILGFPLLNLFFAIMRHYQSHRPIFKPAREDLYHRIMALGLSHKQTVFAIYTINLVLGISAFLLTVVTTSQAILLLFMLTFVVIFVITQRIS